jgi:hypothetical protein
VISRYEQRFFVSLFVHVYCHHLSRGSRVAASSACR